MFVVALQAGVQDEPDAYRWGHPKFHQCVSQVPRYVFSSTALTEFVTQCPPREPDASVYCRHDVPESRARGQRRDGRSRWLGEQRRGAKVGVGR